MSNGVGDDGRFDPSKIDKKVKDKDIPIFEPVDKRAAKPQSRTPIITTIGKALKNSEGSIRRAKQKEMRLNNVENALDESRKDQNYSKADLSKSERDLFNEQTKTTAVATDQDDEIEFNKEKRRIERQNALDAEKLRGARAQPGPSENLKREPTEEEIYEERLRQGADSEFRVFGPKSQIVVNLIEEDKLHYGSWKKIPPARQEHWLREYKIAVADDVKKRDDD